MSREALAPLIAKSNWVPVWSLCVTQVISWGTLYHAFSVLVTPMGQARQWDQTRMMGAFSFSLLLSGLCALPVGLAIQRWSGRWTMAAGSFLAALGLWIVAQAPSLTTLYLGWGIAGIAMSMCLYEAAFATLATIQTLDHRRAVTAVTLAGGFASTVFWPLTEWLVNLTGWQSTIYSYVALQMFVCLPLHLFGGLETRSPPSLVSRAPTTPAPFSLLGLLTDSRFLLLTGSFALNSLVFSSVSAHLIPMMQSTGRTSTEAARFAAFAGPMQVAGRVADLAFGGQRHARRTGLIALMLAIPALVVFGWPGANAAWNIGAVGIYGLSNGIMTIVRSISVVDFFGRQEYPRVSGAIAVVPSLVRSAGPVMASFVLVQTGSYRPVVLGLVGAAVLSMILFGLLSAPKPEHE